MTMSVSDLTRSAETTAAAVARGINACADRLDATRGDLPAARARLAASVDALVARVAAEVAACSDVLCGGLAALELMEADCWPAPLPVLAEPVAPVEVPAPGPGDVDLPAVAAASLPVADACLPLCPDCGGRHDPFLACAADGKHVERMVAEVAHLDKDAADAQIYFGHTQEAQCGPPEAPVVPSNPETTQVEEEVLAAANSPVKPTTPAEEAQIHGKLKGTYDQRPARWLKGECKRRGLSQEGASAVMRQRLEEDDARPKP